MSELSLHDIELHLRSARKSEPKAHVFGFKMPTGRLDPAITHVDGLQIDNEKWRVIETPSELAIRHAMLTRKPDEFLAIVTPLNARDLAIDIRVRLPQAALFDFDPWAVLKMLFAARELSWELNDRSARPLGRVLLRLAYTTNIPEVTAGVLDLQTAWNTYFQLALNFQSPPTRLADWFAWAANQPDAVHTLRTESPEFRQLHAEYLHKTIGSASKPFLKTLATDHILPIALGLLTNAASRAEKTDQSLATAAAILRKGLEKNQYFDDQCNEQLTFAHEAKKAWEVLSKPSQNSSTRRDMVLNHITNTIDDILTAETHEPSTSALAIYSPASRIGWQTHLNHVATLLEQQLDTPKTDVHELKSTLGLITNHYLATRDPELVHTLKNAARLVYRLCHPPVSAPINTTSDTTSSTDLATLATHYIDDLSFVDQIRESLTGRDVGTALAPVVERIIQTALDRSDDFNRRFATDLARQLSASTTLKNTLGIHQVLSEVVAPIAKNHNVLLVVLDGLSWSVARSLLADPQLDAFNTWTPAKNGRPIPMIAALPSVTAFSRTALLTGKLQRGDQSTEAREFPKNPDINHAIGSSKKAVIFHKDALDAAGRGQIGPRVLDALHQPQNRVVALVINAIDDQLDASEQVTFDWTLSSVTPLRKLLEQTRQNVVILVGDHGHIWETATTKPSVIADAARWRSTNTPPIPGELQFTGPMIQNLTGEQSIIAPHTERIRYTGLKRGYHGGASAQELITPLLILTRGDTTLPDGIATPLSTAQPAWWNLETLLQPPSEPAPQSKTSLQPDLFAPPPPPRSLITQLMDSDIFKSQHERFGTHLNIAQIALCLNTIHANHNRITINNLAHVLKLSTTSTSRFATMLASVLNLEGYAVLEINRLENNIRLDPDLLRTQFRL